MKSAPPFFHHRTLAWGFLLATFPAGLLAEPAPLLQRVETTRTLPGMAFYQGQPATWKLAGFFPAGSNAPITADLNLVINGIAAPAQKSLPIFAATNETREAGILTEVSLTLPKVEKSTPFALIFRQANQPIAVQSLEVVPETLGGFFRPLLIGSAGGRGLDVFGPDKTIRKFFDTAKIPYRDLGAEPPDSVRASLESLVRKGGFHSGLILNSEGRALVVLHFSTDSRKPPGVYVRDRAALITLPIAEQLGTDPRTERLLVEALEMLLTQP